MNKMIGKLAEETFMRKFTFLFAVGILLYMLVLIAQHRNENPFVLSQALGIGETGVLTPTPTIGIGNTAPTAAPTLLPSSTPTPTPDLIPPTVTITNPTNGATVRKNTTVTIAANASDNVAVARVDFYVNGNLQCTDSTTPYTCDWFVPNRPRVTYTLGATAVDTSNNTASDSITVTSK